MNVHSGETILLVDVLVQQYMIPWARLGKVKKETNDVESAKALWDWLEEQVKEN